MSGRDPRHSHREDLDSLEEIEDVNVRERQETGSRNRLPTLKLNLRRPSARSSPSST
jgi:hypothetical protein